MKTYCGIDCCKDCDKLSECGGCEKCQGHPFGGNCVAERNKDFLTVTYSHHLKKWGLLARGV